MRGTEKLFYFRENGGREGSEVQSHKEEEGEGRSGTEEDVQGPYLHICAGVQQFLVTQLLMGPVCLLSQGRFEEPVRSSPRPHPKPCYATAYWTMYTG